MSPFRRTLGIVTLVLAASQTARADTWMVAEAPAAVPVSNVQAGVFRPGSMPAFGVYVERGMVALGARARVGVLRDGPAPGDNLSDPGLGGLGTAGLAVRLAHRGLWVEAVVGGGITGRDLVPAVEAGIGWSFAHRAIDIGPSARLVHVVGDATMDHFGSADLLVIGVDVRFGRSRPARPQLDPSPRPMVDPGGPRPAAGPAIVIDSDGDLIVDADLGCGVDPEGCPIGRSILVQDDRIILDERVLFDLDRARVKSRGRAVIAEIAALWREHPEWTRLAIEGHSDARGSDEYNLELSHERADRVRNVFLKLGIDGERLTAAGYGRSKPRDPGTTDEAYQRNRRVEFVIERGGTR